MTDARDLHKIPVTKEEDEAWEALEKRQKEEREKELKEISDERAAIDGVAR